MQLIQTQSTHVQAVLGANFSGKYLIESGIGVIHDPLRRSHDLAPLQQAGRHFHHAFGHIKNNGSLLPVCCRSIYFWRSLSVCIQHIKGNRRSQLALSILLGYFNIGCTELSGPVRLYNAEQVTDDLFLPGQQPERFSGPATFCMGEHLDKANRSIRFIRIVMGIRKHKTGRRIVFQNRIILRFYASHQLPPNSSSISSTCPALLSLPAMILLRAAGVSPNCSAN